ncbi:hypothetical protein FHS49_001001 [Sphingobium boeckii]|uniref:Uncharacterized protein n=2 Tax=Sphingobium boeckii TaxID=1082345 RepID=A0A7W9EEH8_9SPHN|nr:hypothetical protein [Sphingobium boeckii]
MVIQMRALSGAFFLACSSAAGAQTIVPESVASPPSILPAPAHAVILTSAGDNVLRTGAPILLTTSEALTTKGKKLKVGQRIQLEVAESIMLNGQIVIPAGSPAVGEITTVRNKGMWGKSGGINARVLYARANGRQIRLTGQFDDKGKTGTAAVVGALVVIPIAGFFMTGTSAEIPLGTPIKAFLDEDITVAFAAVSSPVMAVPVPVAIPASVKPTDSAAEIPALVTQD